MIKSQLPWLRTAMYHTALDVTKESHSVRMYIQIAQNLQGIATELESA